MQVPGCRAGRTRTKNKIADGAFRQMRLPIEQDAVERACSDRFPFGQNVVQEIGGLDLRIESALGRFRLVRATIRFTPYDSVRVEGGEAVWS